MNHTMKNSTLTYHEIYGQPDSFQAILNTLPEIEATLDEVFSEKYDQLIFTGCGTSLYLAQTSAYLWRAMNSTPAEAVPCSELLFFPENYIKGKKTLVLPITRKSYTTEVRKAIDRVHELPGVTSLAITCDKDSRLYNEHYVLAPDTAEDSVIMTRSFTAMIFLAQILSMHVSGHEEWIKEMAGYREEAGKMLKECDALAEKIVRENPDLNLFITLGQGAYYGISNECMNKMKEMGISNSEAYYSMEYRHGPMSLVDENTLLILLSNEKTEKTDEALMEQMQSFSGVTCGIGPHTDNMKGLRDTGDRAEVTGASGGRRRWKTNFTLVLSHPAPEGGRESFRKKDSGSMETGAEKISEIPRYASLKRLPEVRQSFWRPSKSSGKARWISLYR